VIRRLKMMRGGDPGHLEDAVAQADAVFIAVGTPSRRAVW
jgi:hypothetical protein